MWSLQHEAWEVNRADMYEGNNTPIWRRRVGSTKMRGCLSDRSLYAVE